MFIRILPANRCHLVGVGRAHPARSSLLGRTEKVVVLHQGLCCRSTLYMLSEESLPRLRPPLIQTTPAWGKIWGCHEGTRMKRTGFGRECASFNPHRGAQYFFRIVKDSTRVQVCPGSLRSAAIVRRMSAAVGFLVRRSTHGIVGGSERVSALRGAALQLRDSTLTCTAPTTTRCLLARQMRPRYLRDPLIKLRLRVGDNKPRGPRQMSHATLAGLGGRNATARDLHALIAVRVVLHASTNKAHWSRCPGTWFQDCV